MVGCSVWDLGHRVTAVSMALYRTYRPGRLDEVVGQEHVTGPLRRALENDRVHHAYLFSGPRGCGKTSSARILARSLNCEQGPTPDPCGVCQSCLDLAPNGAGSIDVIELDAASHGGVDDTRDLRERAMFAPASSRYKIYIIDEAHMVTTAGFNALLKLVEEPPEHVRFIFATTEADKVLPTIRSRTYNYAFRLVPVKVLQEHLASVCEREGIPADPAALALVARAGAGSVRDSLSLLGQVISGSGPDGVTYAETVVQLGMTDTALLDAVVEALIAMDGAALFGAIDQVIDIGHDPRRFVQDLLERLRDLLILQHVPDAVTAGLVDAPDDEVERQVDQASRFGSAELSRAADVVNSALSELKGATAPRLQLELLAARLLVPAADDSAMGLRARMDHLERMVTTSAGAAAVAAPVASPAASASTAPAAPPPPLSSVAPSTSPKASAKTPGPPPKPSAEPKAAPPAASEKKAPAKKATAAKSASMSVDDFVSMWPAILEALKLKGRLGWTAFLHARPISVSDGVLAVAVHDGGTLNAIRKNGYDEVLAGVIKETLHVDVSIDAVLAPDAASVTTQVETAVAAPDVDVPSADDPDVDEATGVDLALKALGATQIGEIEH